MPTVLSDPESLTQSSVPSLWFGPDVCMDTMPPRLFFGMRALPRIVVCPGGWYGQDGTLALFRYSGAAHETAGLGVIFALPFSTEKHTKK